MYHILVKQERIKNQEENIIIIKEESEFQEFNFCSHTTSQHNKTKRYSHVLIPPW